MKKYILISSAFICFLLGCAPKKEIPVLDEGTVKDGIYSNAALGWTYKIPEGWSRVANETREKKDSLGREIIENTGVKIEKRGDFKHLINLQKDSLNSFLSNAERFPSDKKSDFRINYQKVTSIIYNAYTSQGLECDTSTTYEQIDGYQFFVFHVDLKYMGILYSQQDIYSRYINGYVFTAALTYHSKEYQKELSDAFRKSKFKKPE